MADIVVRWISPSTNEPRRQVMSEEQAQEWWDAASYPVQCTASFTPVELEKDED